MKILDLYIIKKFLGTFFFVVLLLVAIVSVIDYTEKNDDFMEHQLKLGEVLSYYIDFIPYVASLITPITVFIAVVFVTSKLAGNTEIIAILSSGVSFRRLMIPYMIGALFIAAVSFWLNGWVIPNANKSRIAFEIKYVKSPFYYDERNIHMKISPEAYAYMESYNNNAEVGYRFTLEKIQGNQMLEKLTARRIEWDSTSAKWKLKNWTLHSFKGMEESIDSGNEMDTTLNIHPKDFGSTYGMYETLTLPELDQHIEVLRERGANDIPLYLVEKYIRYMSPFTAIILTFIGVIMSARKARGGSGFQIALGFGIAFLFIIFFIFARSIAETSTVNPIIAVWVPNIIFSCVGLVLYKFIPR
ncbi:LptF/LptG family permease [Catalinimonas niigatensis]|uniref:LptF/LptG family permease n=1 Tax=Catalinimonas niigatensis TaxID=1397264 RepID=UPI00266588F9|nr:LptF/LptG family permease [Catalinimonas niigatensis]WPP50248.1 LptF/LptG family permease [Catalinimonas niigatensis]